MDGTDINARVRSWRGEYVKTLHDPKVGVDWKRDEDGAEVVGRGGARRAGKSFWKA